jgi:hypothetical protein
VLNRRHPVAKKRGQRQDAKDAEDAKDAKDENELATDGARMNTDPRIREPSPFLFIRVHWCPIGG